MSKVYAFMADGLEEIECLAVVDILRRAGVECETVSVTGDDWITGSHNIRVITDKLWKEIEIAAEDVLFLPGGMPGTTNLGAFAPLCEALKAHGAAGGRLAAICAAPSVLGDLGLLAGKKATCYPGFEERLARQSFCFLVEQTNTYERRDSFNCTRVYISNRHKKPQHSALCGLLWLLHYLSSLSSR